MIKLYFSIIILIILSIALIQDIRFLYISNYIFYLLFFISIIFNVYNYKFCIKNIFISIIVYFLFLMMNKLYYIIHHKKILSKNSKNQIISNDYEILGFGDILIFTLLCSIFGFKNFIIIFIYSCYIQFIYITILFLLKKDYYMTPFLIGIFGGYIMFLCKIDLFNIYYVLNLF